MWKLKSKQKNIIYGTCTGWIYKEHEKCAFLDQLDKLIDVHGSDGHNILGGDFNIDIEKPSNTKSHRILKLMITNSEFCDSWTKKNPGQKRFTWQRFT